MKILNLIANKLFYFTCSFLDENGYIKNPILSIDTPSFYYRSNEDFINERPIFIQKLHLQLDYCEKYTLDNKIYSKFVTLPFYIPTIGTYNGSLSYFLQKSYCTDPLNSITQKGT